MGRYINSVPMLTAEHRVKGFVWEVRGFTRDAHGVPILPAGMVYIGGTAGDAILAATTEPKIHLPPRNSVPEGRGLPLSAHPWKLQTHNDAAGTIPFATLDQGGRYAHLESFNVMLDAPDDLPELQWCTFLCGATTGVERLCDD